LNWSYLDGKKLGGEEASKGGEKKRLSLDSWSFQVLKDTCTYLESSVFRVWHGERGLLQKQFIPSSTNSKGKKTQPNKKKKKKKKKNKLTQKTDDPP